MNIVGPYVANDKSYVGDTSCVWYTSSYVGINHPDYVDIFLKVSNVSHEADSNIHYIDTASEPYI